MKQHNTVLNTVLNSKLQGVLSCLDVQLETELNRYRRHKAKARLQGNGAKENPLAALDLRNFTPSSLRQPASSRFSWPTVAPVQHPEMDPTVLSTALSVPLPQEVAVPLEVPLSVPLAVPVPSPSQQSLVNSFEGAEDSEHLVSVTSASFDRYSDLLEPVHEPSQIAADMAVFDRSSPNYGVNTHSAGGSYVVVTEPYTPAPVTYWTDSPSISSEELTVLDVPPSQGTECESDSLDLPPELSDAELLALAGLAPSEEPADAVAIVSPAWPDYDDRYEMSDEDDLWPDELDEEPRYLAASPEFLPEYPVQETNFPLAEQHPPEAIGVAIGVGSGVGSPVGSSVGSSIGSSVGSNLESPVGMGVERSVESRSVVTAIEVGEEAEPGSEVHRQPEYPDQTEQPAQADQTERSERSGIPLLPAAPDLNYPLRGPRLVPVGSQVSHALKPLGSKPRSLSPLDGYLASSEALLDSLEEEEGSQNWTQKLSNLFTPQGIGSALLLIFSALAVSMVLLNPELVSHWKLGRFGGQLGGSADPGSSPQPALETTPEVGQDGSTLDPQPPANPFSQEFLDLDLGNLSKVKPQLSTPPGRPISPGTLGTPTSPVPPSSPGNETEMFSTLRESLTDEDNATFIDDALPPSIGATPPEQPRLEEPFRESSFREPLRESQAPPPLKEEPIVPPPETAPETDSYLVVTPYTSDQLLDQSQAIVPDAYLNNTDAGANIQFGVFSDPDAAAALAEQLQQQGIPVEVVPVE